MKLNKNIFLSIFFFLSACFLAFNFLNPQKSEKPFALGLDLVGGSYLVYEADTSEVKSEDIASSMDALKKVLERRLNSFGTSEVSVRIEKPSIFSENLEQKQRVIIEIPGVTDTQKAKDMIGKIPLLEFKLYDKRQQKYIKTDLTGKYLESSNFFSDQSSLGPVVSLNFNQEGKEIFSKITSKNVGERLGIFLDGQVISSPYIREKISDGSAVINGLEGLDEASELTKNLNFGALPTPIKFSSSDTISPSLGKEVLDLGIKAALIGFVLVILFLIFFYRVSGFLASIALFIYIVFTLSIFKLFGFVFTSAGIAGFIISIGMAVDANIIIFERIKEELQKNQETEKAILKGFGRAWLAIRDGNLSSIITAVILFYLTTSLIKGFALIFGFGVLVSMFTAIFISRSLLLSLPKSNKLKFKKILFGNFEKK